MTVRSARLVRAALAGAVVCLIGVGVAAPALAGSDDGGCSDAGPLRALLDRPDCPEATPDRAFEPGTLLDPQFPDFPDFPGVDDDNSDDSSDDADADEDDSDADEDEDSSTEESSPEDDGTDAAGAGTDSADGGSGDEDSGDSDGAELAAATDPTSRPARKAPADSGAGAAVGAAVIPGVGDAVDGGSSPGLDWTGALTPEGPHSDDTAPVDAAPAVPAPSEPAPADDAPGPPAPSAPAAAAERPAADERIADLAAVSFATSFPSPVEAHWNLGAVLPSLALTLLLLAALALPVGLLNRATDRQPDRVEALLARLRVPPGAGRPAPGAFLTAVAITAVAGAVMLGFLTPAFPFDASAPALLVGLAVAFVLVTAAQQGTQLLYVARWWGVRCHVGPVPGFLLLGAISVVLSRAVGLEPGLVVGTLIAFRTARPLRPDEDGPAVALAATALTALGGTAWILREPLVAAAGAPGTFFADVVATALTATSVSAAANLVFALVPLSFLPGAALLRWSPGLWALFACTGGFAFVHLALQPGAGDLAGRAGTLAVLLSVYLVGAAGLWAWLRHGPVGAATVPTPRPRARAAG